MSEHIEMAEQSYPDYSLPETLLFERVEQYSALFEDTRMQIVELVLERAATIKELAMALEKPPGTIGHHVGVLESAGLIHVVRTKKVRAIEAKYYGRTARTYLLGDGQTKFVERAPDHFLTLAASEFVDSAAKFSPTDHPFLSTLRHVRIPEASAAEWNRRLIDLATEFASEQRGGELTYGLQIALYPTDRPHLPDGGER